MTTVARAFTCGAPFLAARVLVDVIRPFHERRIADLIVRDPIRRIFIDRIDGGRTIPEGADLISSAVFTHEFTGACLELTCWQDGEDSPYLGVASGDREYVDRAFDAPTAQAAGVVPCSEHPIIARGSGHFTIVDTTDMAGLPENSSLMVDALARVDLPSEAEWVADVLIRRHLIDLGVPLRKALIDLEVPAAVRHDVAQHVLTRLSVPDLGVLMCYRREGDWDTGGSCARAARKAAELLAPGESQIVEASV
jgi:hypothetical protein